MMKQLKFNPDKNMEELKKYGWKLDTMSCLTTCEKCKNKEHCRIISEHQYYKSISSILPYTVIYISDKEPLIYGNFDEIKNIYYYDKNYKLIIKSCEDEIKANLLIVEENDDEN